MRKTNGWLVVLVLAAVTAPACGGGSGECSPTCGPGLECYYGVCVPRGPDVGQDGASDGDADGDTPPPDDGEAPPRDDGASDDAADVPSDGGGCAVPEDCADGDPCTEDLCDASTGTCSHPAAPDGTVCDDDGDPCTRDVCMGGACVHPVAGECCTAAAECEDGDPCTTDDCVDHACVSVVRSDCCLRDADCINEEHVWECNVATGTCYAPSGGALCDSCTTQADCGDGAAASDDPCIVDDASERGCAKDCADDLDCPGAFNCWSPVEDRACASGESGCYCFSRFGTCDAIRKFGTSVGGCMFVPGTCRSCTGCESFICTDEGCSTACTVDRDCPWGWWCWRDTCILE